MLDQRSFATLASLVICQASIRCFQRWSHQGTSWWTWIPGADLPGGYSAYVCIGGKVDLSCGTQLDNISPIFPAEFHVKSLLSSVLARVDSPSSNECLFSLSYPVLPTCIPSSMRIYDPRIKYAGHITRHPPCLTLSIHHVVFLAPCRWGAPRAHWPDLALAEAAHRAVNTSHFLNWNSSLLSPWNSGTVLPATFTSYYQ